MPLGIGLRPKSRWSNKRAQKDISLVKLMDGYHYERLKKPKQGRTRGIIHPSQLLTCRRAQQYELLFAPVHATRTQVFMARIWDNGHSTERRLRHSLIEGAKLQGHTFIPSIAVFNPETLVGGEMDGVLITKWGDAWVVDFKTMRRVDFEALLRPPEGYKAQMHGYMSCTGIRQAALFYENKDCVPGSSRILTRDGWKHHSDLIKGRTEILTYNIEYDELQWELFDRKTVFQHDGSLYRIGNKHSSWLSTGNHRWVVETQDWQDRSVELTSEINSNRWVRRASSGYFTTEPSLLTPYEAEVLGWVATDGWHGKAQTTICQSKPAGVEALRELLGSDSEPAFYEREGSGLCSHLDKTGIWYFPVLGDLGRKLRKIMPSKDVLPSVVTRLSTDALEAFYRGMLGGDGSWTGQGRQEQFCQNDGSVKEAFQIASYLLGLVVNINKGKHSCYPSERQRVRAARPTEEHYQGEVWCPTTRNGTWVMEQGGKPTITGNSQFPKEHKLRWSPKFWKKIQEEVIDYILIATIEEELVERDEDLCTNDGCPYFRICLSKSPADFDEVDRRPEKARARLQVIQEKHYAAR